MILNIVFWIFITITCSCILFLIGFLIKIHNWKLCGYNETYQSLANGKLGEVKNPIEMKFSSIENKMYHLGAWESI